MRKIILIVLLLILWWPMTMQQTVMAQSQEAQQLLLNVEKLAQLKGILTSMKQGYRVISKGYNAVKDISKGNFSLHEVFLDGMMAVSPQVKKYHRIADIITTHERILSEYKSALGRLRTGGAFNVGDLNYLISVYERLNQGSLNNLEELLMVITANKLRMNDDERLVAIDRIFADTQDKLSFLRYFNSQVSQLAIQRKRLKIEINNSLDWYK